MKSGKHEREERLDSKPPAFSCFHSFTFSCLKFGAAKARDNKKGAGAG
jgi:hypothetical protein